MEPTGRDDLIESVRYGRMSPDEAEAEAAKRGLGKLATEPDIGSFDPMSETWWTLHMAVAWVVWRTPERVRAYWDAFRRECWDWHYRDWRVGPDGPIHSGFFLEQRRNATFWYMQREETHDASGSIWPHETKVRKAEVKLRGVLEEGVFDATGIDSHTRRRIIIPRQEWRDLEVIKEKDREVLRLCEPGLLPKGGYDEVLLKRAEIMAMWPPPAPLQTGQRALQLVTPEGPGYMPLCCAAYWIATNGGAKEIDPCDMSVWEGAYSELLARVSSDEVAVTGVRDGEREKIAGHTFAAIGVEYPIGGALRDLSLSDEMYLYAGIYIDDEHWQRGFDDKLETRRGVKWGKLMVPKTDVARWWPVSLGEPAANRATIYQSGVPGRPSSMHFVEAEHRERWERGEAEQSVREESRKLSQWLRDKHSSAPPLTPKAIENRIRGEHRRRRAKARN